MPLMLRKWSTDMVLTVSYLLQRLELQASAAMADGMCDHSEMSAEDC